LSDRNLADCSPLLVARYAALKASYEASYPDATLIVTCTRRTTEEQQAEYAKGRTAPGNSVTSKDGVILRSRHQAQTDGLSAALDFAIVLHGPEPSQITWDRAYYRIVGALAKPHGLRWGGTWGDFDHLEIV
jgi:peptidoglycan L-alanyl-D-glutamate endopeptidase CwlK